MTRLDKEGDPPLGHPVIYSDANEIARFFGHDHRALFYSRDHESYCEGYHIELFDTTGNSMPVASIDLFTKSKSVSGQLRDIGVAIPRLGRAGESFGEFESSEFVQWCRDVLIDPGQK